MTVRMSAMSVAYSAAEIDAIAGWLADELTASQIADRLSVQRRCEVSRSAIIGLVHRNTKLAAIGFKSRAPRQRRVSSDPKPAKAAAAPKSKGRRGAGLLPNFFFGAVGGYAPDIDAGGAMPRPARGPNGVSMRSIDDMVAGRNAPLAPGAPEGGLTLTDISPRGCRFAVGNRGGQHLFCAAEVDDWRPGTVNGCYCRTHRAYLTTCPNVGEAA